jgi:hypothetical protein
MAEVAHKNGFSAVFAMRAKTFDLNGRAHRQGCFLPTNPLTDRHSGQHTQFVSEISKASPEFQKRRVFAFFYDALQARFQQQATPSLLR